VGQDEDAQPLVRRTNFCRREQARRRRVTQFPKVSQDGFEAEGDVTGDVFEEDPFWSTFRDNPRNLRPEVARVVGATAFACCAEGLAGISGEDDVECPTKWSGIEAAHVVPDWGFGEIPCALGGDEDGPWPSLPFDKGAGVEAGLGQHDAQIKASAACAEGQSVPGT